jgi:hypothetical protein
VEEVKAPIGFIQAFLLPNVMNYAVAFGFFKLVRNGAFLSFRLCAAGSIFATALLLFCFLALTSPLPSPSPHPSLSYLPVPLHF